MNNVKNKEIPTNTILGGVCWIPSAFRKNDRIMTVREKEVIMMINDGNSATIVRSNKISNVGLDCH